MSRGNFSSPAGNSSGAGNSGAAGGWQRMGGASSGTSESAAHGWNRFGEPIHGTSGTVSGEASQFNRGYSPSAASSREGYGGAVRINPPIVQQSGYSSPGNYSQPRSFGERAARAQRPSEPWRRRWRRLALERRRTRQWRRTFQRRRPSPLEIRSARFAAQDFSISSLRPGQAPPSEFGPSFLVFKPALTPAIDTSEPAG